MTKTCEIFEDGKSVGKRKVEILSHSIIMYGDPVRTISFDHIINYLDSMASADGGADDFEGLQFKFDVEEGGKIKQRLLFDYVTDEDPEPDDYEEEFDAFVRPLRKYFMKALFGKPISQLTDSDLAPFYGTFKPMKGSKYAVIMLSAFFSGVFYFIILAILYDSIYDNMSDLFGSSLSIVAWMSLTALTVYVVYHYFIGYYEITSDSFRFNAKLRHVSIPWNSVTKLTKTEKRKGRSQSIVIYVYTLFYRDKDKELKFKFDGLELQANDFQSLLRVTRTKLKSIPQMRSRGWNDLVGKVHGYVTWEL